MSVNLALPHIPNKRFEGSIRDFIGDRDGRPRQLRFRRNGAPIGSPEVFDGTGQLIAVIADARRTDNEEIIAISRPRVLHADIDALIEHNGKRYINLAQIRRRISAAGLD